MHLEMPMILVTIKMSLEYLFKNHYTVFFDATEKQTGQVLEYYFSKYWVGIDKIFYLIERLFDQNNLYGRFTFIESNFKDYNSYKGTSNDRKFIQKRIFGLSPYMDILIQHPQDGRSKAIFARQHDIDCKMRVD